MAVVTIERAFELFERCARRAGGGQDRLHVVGLGPVEVCLGDRALTGVIDPGQQVFCSRRDDRDRGCRSSASQSVGDLGKNRVELAGE
jgi:hypothetical protein